MLQWGHRSHRIPKELKVVSHFVALVRPDFRVLLGCPPVFFGSVDQEAFQVWKTPFYSTGRVLMYSEFGFQHAASVIIIQNWGFE